MELEDVIFLLFNFVLSIDQLKLSLRKIYLSGE